MSQPPFGFGLPSDKGEDDDGNPVPFGFGPGGPADLGAVLQQLGQMLSQSGQGQGPVSWSAMSEAARTAVLASGEDASCTPSERAAVSDALRLADTWLDAVTELPAAATTTQAWSRVEWLEHTQAQWRPFVEPLATRLVAASTEAVPEEMRAMAGPMIGMLQQMSGALFGMQAGQGLAALSSSVVSSSDVGIPLAPHGTAALVPVNIAKLSEGLGIPDDQVRLYLALREAAHVRLFAHAPWLTSTLAGAVADYARGIDVDVSSIQDAVGGIDPSDPAALQQALSSGVFEPPTTPEQQAAQSRLETVLALIEGWVDVVVHTAASQHLPAADALRETLRRRRAAGGPAEDTFANLVGLQLRPRRLREAAVLWQTLGDRLGTHGRDAVWNHPDLLPDSDDLDAPNAFVDRLSDADLQGPLDLSALDDLPPAPEENPPGSDAP